MIFDSLCHRYTTAGMEEWLEDTIIEEREEVMVPPTGGVPYKKTAHFLKPNVASIKGPSLKLPSLSPKCKWPLEVAFHGWKDPPRKWKKWVENLNSKYQNVWKQADVYEAVMASTYKVYRNNELIFSVVERWCSETNTFLFPWGEATVTLEDMIVLGGYSVLGGPVSLPLQEKESIIIEEELKKARKDLVRLNNCCYVQWLNLFMESGNQFEHEAFLSMWLSIFVFPGNHHDSVNEQVFPIAIRLARGTRIALAPAVLASIYRDLSLLKETMAAAVRLSAEDGEDSLLALTVWAPFHLVQIWAWERLVSLQPKPNFINAREPRVARWNGVNQADTINMRPAIDSGGEAFLWRPYALAVDKWSLPKFYKEKEEWLPIGEGFNEDEDLESFARCLRVCELLGVDCKEPYQPHRVAMQFGFDQDLPKWIPRSFASPEMAWYNYSRPFENDAYLFLPSRLSESDVTYRYMDWWRKRVTVPVDAVQGLVQRPRSARRSRRSVKRTIQMVVKNEPDVPPGSPPKCNSIEEEKPTSALPWHSSTECRRTEVLLRSIKIKTEPEPDVPPGFPPKRKGVEDNLCTRVVTCNKRHSNEERLPEPDVPPGFPPKQKEVEENLRDPLVTMQACNKMHSNEERVSSNENLSLDTQFPNQSPPTAGTEASGSLELLEKVEEQIMQNEAFGGQSNASSDPTLVSISQSEEQKNSSVTFQLPGLVDLEARINRIERFLAGLKSHPSI